MNGKAIHIPSEFKIESCRFSVFQRWDTVFVREADNRVGFVSDGDIDVVDFLCGRAICVISRGLLGLFLFSRPLLHRM